MKNSLHHLGILRSLAIMSVALMVPALACATVITIVPSTLNASIGQTINASLVVSGLTSTLGAYDIDVSVNPSVLEIPGLNSLSPTNVTFSNALGNPNDPTQTVIFFGGDTSPNSGTEELIDISLLGQNSLATLQSSTAFTLATLDFTVIGAGTTSITPTLPSSGVALSDVYGNPLSVTTFNAATVNNTSVPEPGSVTLFLIGIALLGAIHILSKRRSHFAPSGTK